MAEPTAPQEFPPQPLPDPTALIATAITAARALAGTRPGPGTRLILAGFHHRHLVALTRHTATTIPASAGIDAAVVIVPGTPRHIGPILAELPPTLTEMNRHGIHTLVIGCRTLEPGTPWTDLTGTLDHDGLIPTPPRPSRPPRRAAAATARIAAELIGILIGLAILVLALWALNRPGNAPCQPVSIHMPISSYAHQSMDRVEGAEGAGSDPRWLAGEVRR